MPLFSTIAKQLYSQSEALRSQRDQVADNSARQAFFTTTHRVHGAGTIMVKTPVKFDTSFTAKPAFFFGPDIISLKNDHKNHWRYPLCNAGVWKWVTEPTPEAKSRKKQAVADTLRALGTAIGSSGVAAANALEDSAKYSESELLYNGAYLFFIVTVDPLLRPRTDGSDLTSLQEQHDDPSTSVNDKAVLALLIKEAKEAIYLTAHPPVPVIEFSVVFMGDALKPVGNDTVDALHADPAIPPIVPPTPTPTTPSAPDDNPGDG